MPDTYIRPPTASLEATDLAQSVERKMVAHAIGLADFEDGTGIDRAVLHHMRAGGKRFRARLSLSVSEALGIAPEDAVCLAASCELLHNASLVHDDLQDGDHHRRDAETVWSRFGSDIAICAGDLMISAAFAALSDISMPARLGLLINLVHKRVAEATHGQTADLSLKGRNLADLDTYERVAAAKSGSLLSLPIELSLIYSGHSSFMRTARSAAHSFAIGYQIADDLDDVAQDSRSDAHESAVNAVLVLRAAGHHTSAEELARARAIELFARAVQLSHELPNGCGRPLAIAAAQFSERL